MANIHEIIQNTLSNHNIYCRSARQAIDRDIVIETGMDKLYIVVKQRVYSHRENLTRY